MGRRRLVAAHILGSDRQVRIDPERSYRSGEKIVVNVGEDREPITAPMELPESLGDIWKRRRRRKGRGERRQSMVAQRTARLGEELAPGEIEHLAVRAVLALFELAL